jgi:hypothetical protein
MERIPVSAGYRKELTWRFRFNSLLIIIMIVTREYLRARLQLEFCKLPFEAIWNPPPRDGSPDAVALVEFLNYCYMFLFVLWIRDGLILSLDFVGLRIRETFGRLRPRPQAMSRP